MPDVVKVDDDAIKRGGFSRRTFLKGGVAVGTGLAAAPVLGSFGGTQAAASAAPRSGSVVAPVSPAELTARALVAAKALGSGTCTPAWSGYTMPITADCVDPRYNDPFIDVNEPRTTANGVGYQYVHGGFTGTDAKFSFAFPPAHQYQGRFFQFTYPLLGVFAGLGLPVNEDDTDANIEFSIASGGYDVHTNSGGTEAIMSNDDDLVRHLDPSQGAYRVNAAAAKFSRAVAAQMYGPHRPFGYIYGASGGAFQTIAAAENTTGVWDGAVPEVPGTPNSIPSNFTIEIYGLRVISPQSFAKIVDALAPGGSGDPFAGLSQAEQAALRETQLLGFPLRGWWDFATLSAGRGLLDLTGGYVQVLDPTYVDDFFNLPGYEGHDNPALSALRIVAPATVTALVGSPPRGLVLSSVPSGDLTGAYVIPSTGAAAGKLIPLGSVSGNTVTFGLGADPTVDSLVQVGDEVSIDNSWFLAFQTYHRHQIPPPDANLYGWNQYRDDDGTPKYPQREILTGPLSSAGPTGNSSGFLSGPGAIQSGAFHGKMIVLGSLMDDSAFPWSADWYRTRVEAAHHGDLDKDFRIWFTDNADHTDPPNTAAQAITVGYDGVVQQALRDVANWVERGVAPPASTNYRVVDTQIEVEPTAKRRRGIQPVATLAANGHVRADISAGQTVTFSAEIEVPPGAGDVVKAEWDFLGLGSFPDTADIGRPSPRVRLTAKFAYTNAGTFFPVLRVTSQRQGDPNTPFGQIQNLVRARVVVH